MIIKYFKGKKEYTSRNFCNDFYLKINQDEHHRKVVLVAKNDITLSSAEEWFSFHANFRDLYFLNGYQSWTDTKEFRLSTRLRNIYKSPHIIAKKFAMDAYGDARFYKYSIKKSHGYDFFYSKGKYESFLYSVNFNNAYLIFELVKDRHNLHLSSDIKNKFLKAGEEFVIFDYYFFSSIKEGLDSFNETFPKKNLEKIFGYTSWYNYYQDINEEIILRDLEGLDSRFNLFQIDDGYEEHVGDWLDVDEKKFPNGLKPIVDKIHEKGLKAGIWLAPFVCEKESKLFKEHPDWVRKDEKGKPLTSGGNWSGHFALDVQNKEVRDYIQKCLEKYVELGFDFFKLDFLYAVAIPEYEGFTRAFAQNYAYKFLRDVLKDKLILGCGAVISSSYGCFDYLRVGPDVSLEFDDVAYMKLFHRERISTKVTIQNTIYRSFFNERLFGNDPDVFLLRDDNIKLSFKQRKALIKINALFGSVLMTSDNLAQYDKTKKELLKEALELFNNATVIKYERKKDSIVVNYLLDNKQHALSYNTKKGVLEYDR